MNKPSLNVVRSDRTERELDRIAGVAKPKTMSVPLARIVPLLVDAAQTNRAWLNDFSEDLVDISCDLYELLLAYDELNHSGPDRRAA